jgi:hypothetical protein
VDLAVTVNPSQDQTSTMNGDRPGRKGVISIMVSVGKVVVGNLDFSRQIIRQINSLIQATTLQIMPL